MIIIMLINSQVTNFRSTFCIDIFNCDIMSSIEKSKSILLLCEQQVQVNCLYALCQAKSNHLTINGLSTYKINDMIETSMPCNKQGMLVSVSVSIYNIIMVTCFIIISYTF